MKKSKIIIVSIISFFAIIILVINIHLTELQKDYDFIKKNNFTILKKDNSCNGEVTFKYKGKGEYYYILDDTIFVQINNYGNNYLYYNYSIENQINLNDSILKNIGSDTIYIYKGNNIFYYIENKNINRELEKNIFEWIIYWLFK